MDTNPPNEMRPVEGDELVSSTAFLIGASWPVSRNLVRDLGLKSTPFHNARNAVRCAALLDRAFDDDRVEWDEACARIAVSLAQQTNDSLSVEECQAIVDRALDPEFQVEENSPPAAGPPARHPRR